MVISDAVKTAVNEDKYITLPEFKGSTKIKPTNEFGNCVIINELNQPMSHSGWQPTAKDLIREDWLVVD